MSLERTGQFLEGFGPATTLAIHRSCALVQRRVLRLWNMLPSPCQNADQTQLRHCANCPLSSAGIARRVPPWRLSIHSVFPSVVDRDGGSDEWGFAHEPHSRR